MSNLTILGIYDANHLTPLSTDKVILHRDGEQLAHSSMVGELANVSRPEIYVGDGTLGNVFSGGDVSTVIQAYLDYAATVAPCTVKMPKGSFIANNLAVDSYVTFDGGGCEILSPVAGTNPIIKNKTANSRRYTIRNFKINVRGYSSMGVSLNHDGGVYPDAADPEPRLSDVLIIDSLSDSFRFTGARVINALRCRSRGAGNDGFSLLAGATDSTNDCLFVECSSSSAGRDAFHVETSSNSFVAIKGGEATRYGFYCGPGCINSNFSGCIIDHSTSGDWRIEGNGNCFVGCGFQNGAGSGITFVTPASDNTFIGWGWTNAETAYTVKIPASCAGNYIEIGSVGMVSGLIEPTSDLVNNCVIVDSVRYGRNSLFGDATTPAIFHALTTGSGAGFAAERSDGVWAKLHAGTSGQIVWENGSALRFVEADSGELPTAAAYVQTKTRMAIDTNGNVGINKVSPQALLDVDGDVIINDSGADKDVRIEGDTDINLLFTDASADRVGVGTNAPAKKLDVQGAAIIDGNTDAVQFTVQGHSTQTTKQILTVETSAGADLFNVTVDGLLETPSIHNAVNGTAATQCIASGTYTPTITNGANVASSTQRTCSWLRIGSVVTVSGACDIDPTAGATRTVYSISLPIASDLAVPGDCCGTLGYTTGTLIVNGIILPDITSNVASAEFTSDAGAGNQTHRLLFQYLIK